MNSEDLRVIKTKRNLQLALIGLLKEIPLEKITVTELCQNSGITRKTFYLHYENVATYFAEFIEQLLDELEEAMLKTTNYRLETHNELEPQMIHLFEHVYENKEFYQFIFNRNSSFTYYELFFNRIKLLVKRSAKSIDEHRELTDFEVSYQANAILGVIMEWYYHDFQQSIDEMNRILYKAFRI